MTLHYIKQCVQISQLSVGLFSSSFTSSHAAALLPLPSSVTVGKDGVAMTSGIGTTDVELLPPVPAIAPAPAPLPPLKQPHVNVYPISPHRPNGPATIINALKKKRLNTTAIKQLANSITPNCKNKKMWQKKRKIQLPAVVIAAPAMEIPNLVSMSCTRSFLELNGLPLYPCAVCKQ